MTTSRIVAVAAAVALAGALTAQAQQVSEKGNRNRKLITAEEIDAAHVNNAYQVIEKLHPEYLQRVTRIQTLGSGRISRGSSRGEEPAAAPAMARIRWTARIRSTSSPSRSAPPLSSSMGPRWEGSRSCSRSSRT